ncbi:MAG: hypothetical protein AYK22_06680 [Thermoplasmatales archaeon SG8-52-3]|nr:MAG: hypothetical protein AYK22_06680 [Thermoplasmatales archaeon SG8-52-3]
MKVIIRVVSQKGICNTGHKPGDEIIVTENGVEGKICLTALYSILPKAFAVLYDAKFPWIKKGQKPRHACPDSENPVIFELEKVE